MLSFARFPCDRLSQLSSAQLSLCQLLSTLIYHSIVYERAPQELCSAKNRTRKLFGGRSIGRSVVGWAGLDPRLLEVLVNDGGGIHATHRTHRVDEFRDSRWRLDVVTMSCLPEVENVFRRTRSACKVCHVPVHKVTYINIRAIDNWLIWPSLLMSSRLVLCLSGLSPHWCRL